MKVQFIYTFNVREQHITPYMDFMPAFLESKSSLTAYAFTKINKAEQKELIKISCCVCETGDIKPPAWYMDCNGKIWIDDLETFRKENGIKSTVSQDYINEFMANN